MRELIISSQGFPKGESNSGANIGTGGVGIYKRKDGVELEFKKVISESDNIIITDDIVNDLVKINFNSSYYVTIDGDETITGIKTFEEDATFNKTIVASNLSGTNTGDMANNEVKIAYEANLDTNAFTDAEQTKLSILPIATKTRYLGSNCDGSDGAINRTLTHTGNILDSSLLWVSGRILHPTDEYTVSGAIITFLVEIFNDDIIHLLN